MPAKPPELHQCPHVRAGAESWLHLTLTPAKWRQEDPDCPTGDDHELCGVCANAVLLLLQSIRVPAVVAVDHNTLTPGGLALVRRPS